MHMLLSAQHGKGTSFTVYSLPVNLTKQCLCITEQLNKKRTIVHDAAADNSPPGLN